MSSRGYSILLNTYTDNVFDMGVGSGVSYGMESADRMLDYMLFCNRDYKGCSPITQRLPDVLP